MTKFLKVLFLIPLAFLAFSQHGEREYGDEKKFPPIISTAYAYEDFNSLSFTQETFTCNANSMRQQSSRNSYSTSGTGSGLMYFGARYYDPTTGRFTSPDPIEGDIYDPRSLNRYAYGYNNPLRYVDPWGLTVTYEDKRAEDLFNSYYSFLPPEHPYAQDIKALIDSDVEYHIIFKAKHPKDKYIGGKVFVTGPQNTNRVNVQIYDIQKHWSPQSRLAHELRHAVQFEQAHLGFTYPGNPKDEWGKNFYDIYDEVDAFDAQIFASQPGDFLMFRGRLRDYNRITNPKDRANYLLQNMGYGQKNLYRDHVQHGRAKTGIPGSERTNAGNWWHFPYPPKPQPINPQAGIMNPNMTPTPFIQPPSVPVPPHLR